MNEITNKNSVIPEHINSNILSSTILRIDLAGIVDIRPYMSHIKPEIDKEKLLLNEDVLKDEDILLGREYEVLSSDVNIMKNALGKESVFRLSKNNGKVSITISRYFINIQLDYSEPHTLRDYILLIDTLITKLSLIDYVRIERLSLRKINYIVCSTLNNLYKCLEKKLWNDISLELKNHTNEPIEILSHDSNSSFIWNDFMVNVNRFIEPGVLSNNANKIVFQGTLDIDTYKYIDSNESLIDSKHFFESMNKSIFEIFKLHITLPFLKDLITGNSKKVMMGVKLNGNGNNIHI